MCIALFLMVPYCKCLYQKGSKCMNVVPPQPPRGPGKAQQALHNAYDIYSKVRKRCTWVLNLYAFVYHAIVGRGNKLTNESFEQLSKRFLITPLIGEYDGSIT